MELDKSISWKNLTQLFCYLTVLIHLSPNFGITDFKFCIILLHIYFFLRTIMFIPYEANGNATICIEKCLSSSETSASFYSLSGIMFYNCSKQIYQQITCINTFRTTCIDNAKMIHQAHISVTWLAFLKSFLDH